MKFSATLIAAVAAFLPLIEAHCQMIMPQPYSFNTDNAPLLADGSNFPCKMPAGASVTSTSGGGQVYTPGEAGQFQIEGSAVHGGGSCQISITYDNPPTKDSVFKVVQSYEGSCPIFTPGNLPADPTNKLPPFSVTLPEGLKAGPATFVWTWFNKIGNREMYMNCAPITIGGSASSDDVYNSLPDMFVANIKVPQSQCTTKETFDIEFPNPGKNLVKSTDACNFAPACGGSAGSTSGGSSSSGSSTPPSNSAPASGSGSGSGSGGAFIGVTTSVYNAPPAATFTPIASTTLTTVPTSSSGSSSSGSSSGSSGSYNSGSGASAGSSGSSSGASGSSSGGTSGSSGSSSGGSYGSGNGSTSTSGTCDGSWIIKCNSPSDTSFTECYGAGSMTQTMATPPGMTCSEVAAAHAGGYNKFKRTAREHLKRMIHRHSRH